MAAQKTARASPELRKGSTQPALPSVLHHHPGHKLEHNHAFFHEPENRVKSLGGMTIC